MIQMRWNGIVSHDGQAIMIARQSEATIAHEASASLDGVT